MPKHVQIARQIEEEIHKGSWSEGRMPGVRALAKKYGTSVVTASRALQELTDRGLVDMVERSGCYVRNSHTTSEVWALCQRITAGPWRAQMERTFESDFEEAIRREGDQLRHDLLGFEDGTPVKELQRKISEAQAAGVRGVFFLPSRKSEAGAARDTEFLSRCEAAGLPVVLIERGLRGNPPLTTDLVSYDDFTAGRELAEHLLQIGRKRIAFVVGSRISSHDSRLAGYLLALVRSGKPHLPIVLEEPSGLAAKEVFSWIADRLEEASADAVICYQDYTAVGLVLELLHRRYRLPMEMAVAGFEDRPIGRTFAVGITTYAFSDAEVGRRALRVMYDRISHPAAPPARVAVTGELIIRESTLAQNG